MKDSDYDYDYEYDYKNNGTTSGDNESEEITVKDCNGKQLQNGDAVQITQDLKVKGFPKGLKRGHTFKNIRLTDSTDNVECKEGKSTLIIKTCYLKKKK